jgi:hypothetical protein
MEEADQVSPSEFSAKPFKLARLEDLEAFKGNNFGPIHGLAETFSAGVVVRLLNDERSYENRNG